MADSTPHTKVLRILGSNILSSTATIHSSQGSYDGTGRENSFLSRVSNPYRTSYRHLGSRVTSGQHAELMKRLSVFKDWFLRKYELEGSSNNVMAIHIDTIQPKYRDEYPGNGNPDVPGLRSPFLSAILGAAELAIPSEKVPSLSPLTWYTKSWHNAIVKSLNCRINLALPIKKRKYQWWYL